MLEIIKIKKWISIRQLYQPARWGSLLITGNLSQPEQGKGATYRLSLSVLFVHSEIKNKSITY